MACRKKRQSRDPAPGAGEDRASPLFDVNSAYAFRLAEAEQRESNIWDISPVDVRESLQGVLFCRAKSIRAKDCDMGDLSTAASDVHASFAVSARLLV
jgi:hypothetical protein